MATITIIKSKVDILRIWKIPDLKPLGREGDYLIYAVMTNKTKQEIIDFLVASGVNDEDFSIHQFAV